MIEDRLASITLDRFEELKIHFLISDITQFEPYVFWTSTPIQQSDQCSRFRFPMRHAPWRASATRFYEAALLHPVPCPQCKSLKFLEYQNCIFRESSWWYFCPISLSSSLLACIHLWVLIIYNKYEQKAFKIPPSIEIEGIFNSFSLESEIPTSKNLA